MKTIVFNTFGPLNSVWKGSMFPLPAVFALRDTKVYVCTSDSGNIAFYIEVSVNQFFYFTTTLLLPL